MLNLGTVLLTLWVVVLTSLSMSENVVAKTSRVPREKVPKGPITFDVKLYAMKQFEGKMLLLKVVEDTCSNLPSSWEKQVSSVDPEGCIILYADMECRGFRKRLDKWSFGSSNLKDIAFESKLSSISSCPNAKKPIVVTEEL